MIKLRRTFEVPYKEYTLKVEQTEYATNGRYALQAYVDGDPFDTLTVNIEAYDREFPQAKYIFINENHCPGIKEALQDAGLIEDLKCKVQSGYYMYPVARWLR